MVTVLTLYALDIGLYDIGGKSVAVHLGKCFSGTVNQASPAHSVLIREMFRGHHLGNVHIYYSV